jgi:hypothetical protein
MKKKTIILPLAFAAGVMLIFIGLEVGSATGLMPIFVDNGKGEGIKTSSSDNLADIPANCNVAGEVRVLICHEGPGLSGAISYSLPGYNLYPDQPQAG